MVVMEALKFRFNRGKRDTLCFYRDSTGNEVDLIMEFGKNVFPVEIKAGATVGADYFKGLKYFARINPDLPWGSGIVYGGDTVQVRSDCKIYPALLFHELLSAVGQD